MKQRPYCVLAALSCAVITGCKRTVLQDGSIEFAVQSWVPLLIVLAGAAAAASGVLLICQTKRLAGILVALFGLLAAGAFAPGLYSDRVIVSDQGFESTHGFWWDPVVHRVRYDDLSMVQGVVEERTGRRGRKEYSYYFDCSFKSGVQERIPLGDLMREALPDILAQFQEHKVPVLLPPNMPK